MPAAITPTPHFFFRTLDEQVLLLKGRLGTCKSPCDQFHVRIQAVALSFFALKTATHTTITTLGQLPLLVVYVPVTAILLLAHPQSRGVTLCSKLTTALPSPSEIFRGAVKATICWALVILLPCVGLISPRSCIRLIPKGFSFASKTNSPAEDKITESSTEVGFAGICGMRELKDQMQQLINQLKFPLLAKEYGISPVNGILMTGPPGCGKTFFARKFCQEAEVQLGKKISFHTISGSKIGSKWLYETVINIAQVFEQAEEDAITNKAFSVIFIDEIDTLFNKDEKHTAKLGEMGEILMKLNNAGSKNIIVMAATNHPERLDPALIRSGRFDYKMAISLPDLQTRLGALNFYFKNVRLDSKIDLEKTADELEGCNMADLVAFTNNAKRLAFNNQISSYAYDSTEMVSTISQAILDQSLQSFKANQKTEKKSSTNTCASSPSSPNPFSGIDKLLANAVNYPSPSPDSAGSVLPWMKIDNPDASSPLAFVMLAVASRTSETV